MSRLLAARLCIAILLGSWILSGTLAAADTRNYRLSRFWAQILMPDTEPETMHFAADEKVPVITCRDYDVAKNLAALYWAHRYDFGKYSGNESLLRLIAIQIGRSRVDPQQLCKSEFVIFKSDTTVPRPENNVVSVGLGRYVIWDSGSLLELIVSEEISSRR